MIWILPELREMAKKFNFIVAIFLMFGLGDFAVYGTQDNHLSCEADDDTYLCYNTATNKFYKIPRDNIDQLLIDSVIETGNDIISDEAPTVEESDSVDNFNDESLGLIPTKSRQSRLGLPIFKRFDGPVFWPRVNKRFSGRRKYYSFYWPFTISRKRPFDSISYRGSFTGFGKK